MLYREIIAVRSQIHTKPIHTLCGQNADLRNVTTSGYYNYQCADVPILTFPSRNVQTQLCSRFHNDPPNSRSLLTLSVCIPHIANRINK
jgi:hypothetical protein